MKVWIKLLIGAILGIALGHFAPDSQRFMDSLVWLEQFVLGIGRYAIIPVLVFSLAISVYELRQDGQFWPLVIKNILLIAGISVFVIGVGVLVTLAFPTVRIPIIAEEQLDVIRLDVAENIKELFPYNMFSVLAGEGVYLFPVYVFAFFFGMGLSYDKNYSKPIISITDSLSRIFLHILSFFIELLGFIMIVLSAYWMIRFKGVLQAGIFFNLVLLLGLIAVVLGFGIFPLFLYLVRPKVNPWAVLYGSLGPAIAAFFSGDINFTLPVLIRHTKENFGVRRRSNVVSLTLFSSFCRAGSAMVAAVAFIFIFKSYSRTGISFSGVMSIGIRAFVISFLLARHPGDGAYTALAVLCLGYGQGFEAGCLILKPMAFYLVAVGTFLDVMIASFSAYAIARLNGYIEEKHMKHFV
ncbi:MAG: cation:dicarboxylase symporter family transporter [Treponema sp.]|jgi:Na+/H+-dicarboxylate symporter|nr:cation:dicarboxylase symporter family transporter [Treponema sp.]